MENGSDDASASVLFGLAGFVVRAQTMRDGEWWLAVETSTTRAACPGCGVFGVGNGRRRVVVRDMPIAGVPVIIVWAKRTWRCREELCERGSWSEASPQIASRGALTERARRHIYRRVGKDLDTVAELAREFGVGWATAHQCVIDYGDAAIAADDRLDAVSDLGVDEHTFAHNASNGGTKMATTFVDLQRGRLLDVMRGRSGEVVRDWVRSQPIWWADQIEVAAIDAFRGYANAIVDVLPTATLVIDHFHAIRLANQAITQIRQRVQNETECDDEQRRWFLAGTTVGLFASVLTRERTGQRACRVTCRAEAKGRQKCRWLEESLSVQPDSDVPQHPAVPHSN